MKKLLNDPRSMVRESLEGLVAAHADLLRLEREPTVVVRADAPVAGRVAVVSGGGSGHGPLHAGFVGRGMLDAAVPGEVFTSPTPAAPVRGVRSMGVGLVAGTSPIAGRPSFDLPEDEVEVGIGIHGEPGRRRLPHGPADEVTDLLLEPVLEDLGLEAEERVLLLVNGMGSTPLAELYIVYRHARRVSEDRGGVVARSLVGEYVTSLDMAGASVTVLRLDDELTELFDAPVLTPGLRWGV